MSAQPKKVPLGFARRLLTEWWQIIVIGFFVLIVSSCIDQIENGGHALLHLTCDAVRQVHGHRENRPIPLASKRNAALASLAEACAVADANPSRAKQCIALARDEIDPDELPVLDNIIQAHPRLVSLR